MYCASHFHEVLTTRRYRLSINRGPSSYVRHTSADRETSDVSRLDFRTVSDSYRNVLRRSRCEHASDGMQLSAQRREKFARTGSRVGDAANPGFNARQESGISIYIANGQRTTQSRAREGTFGVFLRKFVCTCKSVRIINVKLMNISISLQRLRCLPQELDNKVRRQSL